MREELRDIVVAGSNTGPASSASGDRWEQLQHDVLDRAIDPWAAADEMLKGVGA